MVERSKEGLGVSLNTPNADIAIDASGCVNVNSGGMSVSPSLATLPKHRVPKRLRQYREGASASDEKNLAIWVFGDGEFVSANLTSQLFLNVDKPFHGQIEPKYSMELNDYEQALGSTREDWSEFDPREVE